MTHRSPRQKERLLALRDAIISAKVASREIDLSLAVVFGYDAQGSSWRSSEYKDWERVPEWSSSIDAAYALVTRKYPKCAFELAYGPKNFRDDYEAICRLWPDNSTSFWDQPKKPQAATPALAICLALVNAEIGVEPKPARKKAVLPALADAGRAALSTGGADGE